MTRKPFPLQQDTRAAVQRMDSYAAALSPHQIAGMCSQRHVQSVLEKLQCDVAVLVAFIQAVDAASVRAGSWPTDHVERLHGFSTTSIVPPKVHDAVTVFGHLENPANVLPGSANSRYGDHVHLAGVTAGLRAHEVDASLASGGDLQTPISGNGDGDKDRAAVHNGIERHGLGAAVGGGREGADELQKGPPLLVCPGSVQHTTEEGAP